MTVPFIMLLVAFVPVIGMRDDVWTVGAVSAILAAALMVMAIAMPVDGLNRFTRLLRPVLIIVLAAPAAWMLLQVIPVPHRAGQPDLDERRGCVEQAYPRRGHNRRRRNLACACAL